MDYRYKPKDATLTNWKTMKFLLALFLIAMAPVTNSAIIASNNSKIESNKKTHIIIVGTAEDLGELFFRSAETKAKLIQSLYPDDQIILLSTNEEKDLIKQSSFFKTIHQSRTGLKESTIEEVVDQVASIASIDIFAHSNAVQGVILDKTAFAGYSLGENEKIWGKIKTKLLSNSYVMIHGCNAAVKTAPALARQLGVAVLGALTSTDFQFVYNNQQWAHDYNAKSLSSTQDKRVRMRPDNFSYRGHWGDWSAGGFPTYKVFCGDLDLSTCQLSALEAIITFPSIVDPKKILSIEDFKQNLYDFLCPFSDKNDVFSECVKHLENSLITAEDDFYSPFKGPTLNCSFERCEANFKCSARQINFNPGSCKLVNENKSKSDAFIKEFKFYIKAYDLKTDADKNRLVR